ncbi:ubiquinone biosynthesis accessory factor UbiJ [[Haemophilus] ducreyi]|uniref:Ubiquinone biosynthesis accessory factor UbiJ n=2 Tax=Haemophilus ducreyi TaxID=730 RepID=Q7VN61_HAEDU|nr:SCP2 sterol-binding domain-containing protein [[Haemophilus] ducreyi]AAP95632.1 hypothetical protein HD_0718 [[Haemophilus] ducreyi 35000HP]ANF60750.1 hypothetical protein A6036_05630 [[Haemophilus] ducreyi]ANF62666.1 hypothetical protein A6038_00105 [[Haemophilus] ducreyi]ANF64313.1 hypothetical protein A6039_01095 [[Haemophilus] ducreyi]ANF66603.1 hypothetical protein A6040_05760 [[Haemophilus] ducreyi]
MMLLDQLKQQLMLPQFSLAALETLLNALIKRSPHVKAPLGKLHNRILQIELSWPKVNLFFFFSHNRIDCLSDYPANADCCIQLALDTLPQLADKQKLTELINHKKLVLTGDLEVLQHFNTLLSELEQDPAELLSPFVGDVLAQSSTNFAQRLFRNIKKRIKQNNQHLIDNLMQERPVLVHRLQAVHFYDQIADLEQQAKRLEQKLAQCEKNK